VLEDHVHAAELVADHFISRGFTNLMFYSDTDNWSYKERGEAFVVTGHFKTSQAESNQNRPL